jgi:hypothetical protein
MSERAEEMQAEQLSSGNPADIEQQIRSDEALKRLASTLGAIKAEYGTMKFMCAIEAPNMPHLAVVGCGDTLKDTFLLALRASEYLKSAYLSDCEASAAGATRG